MKKLGLKYRLYPNADQERRLFACLAIRRKSWNKLHELVTTARECENPPSIGEAIKSAMKEVRRMKYSEEFLWMREYPPNVSEYVSMRYVRSWKAFFDKIRTGELSRRKAEYVARRIAAGKEVKQSVIDGMCKPGFQARSDEEAFQVKGSDCTVDALVGSVEFKGSGGQVRFKLHRPLDCVHIGTVTIAHTNIGEWYIAFTVDQEGDVPDPAKHPATIMSLDSNIAGYMDDEKNLHEHPRPYKEKQDLEGRLKRQLLRKQKGDWKKEVPPSKRYLKAKKRLNKLQKKIQRIREDWQHKTSAAFVARPEEAIAIESLSIQEMMKRPVPIPGKTAADFLPNGATDQRRINLAMADVSHARFLTMLEYKCKWNGKVLIKVDPEEATNKTCSKCGHINDHVNFKMKKWTCSECGEVHEKYVNGAKLIRRSAERTIVGRPIPEPSGKCSWRAQARRSEKS